MAGAHSMEVTTMNKRVLIPLVLASVMLVSATAFAVTDAEIQACFKAHSSTVLEPYCPLATFADPRLTPI